MIDKHTKIGSVYYERLFCTGIEYKSTRCAHRISQRVFNFFSAAGTELKPRHSSFQRYIGLNMSRLILARYFVNKIVARTFCCKNHRGILMYYTHVRIRKLNKAFLSIFKIILDNGTMSCTV